MGKRHVHVVVVRKPVSVALLVVTSGAIAALLYFLSGRAYAGQADPLREMLTHSLSLARDQFLAFLMPVLANILVFLPWGFLAFVVLDRPPRSRTRIHLMTFVAGLVFAASLQLWQHFLPTIVLTLSDSVANGLGALAGAMLGHMRKGVRVRFDF